MGETFSCLCSDAGGQCAETPGHQVREELPERRPPEFPSPWGGGGGAGTGRMGEGTEHMDGRVSTSVSTRAGRLESGGSGPQGLEQAGGLGSR